MTRHQGLEQRSRRLPPGQLPDTSGLGVSGVTVQVRVRSDDRAGVTLLHVLIYTPAAVALVAVSSAGGQKPASFANPDPGSGGFGSVDDARIPAVAASFDDTLDDARPAAPENEGSAHRFGPSRQCPQAGRTGG